MMLPILLLSFCPGAGLGDAPVEGPPSLLRTYDLRSYGGPVTDYGICDLFPAVLAMNHDDKGEPGWSFSPDFLQEVLFEILGEEFEYEGRRYSVTDHEQLILYAPQAVQDRTRELLNFFSQASRPSASLQVDILDLEESGLEFPVGVVDAASIAQLLELQTASPARSYSIALKARSESRIHDTSSFTFVGDYDVEVAQSAVSFDPVLITMQTGVRLRVKAGPAQGGCNLALRYLSGASESGVVKQSLDASARVATDSGFERVSGPEILQSMDVGQRTLALNTMIPSGKALVIRSQSAGGTQLLILRLKGTLQPAIRSTRVAGQRELHLIRRDALSPGQLSFEGEALDVLGNQEQFRGPCRHEAYALSCEYRREDFDLPMDVIQDAWPDMEFVDNQAWIFGFQPEGAAEGDGRKLTELVHSLQPASDLVQVSLRLERGGAHGEPVLACDLPLRVGPESAIVLGTEFSTVADYDIEIAQAASISDPGVYMDLDGALFAVTPSRSADGRLQVRIRGAAQVLRDNQEVHAGDRSYGPLYLPTYDRLLMDQTLYFAGADGGQAVIGNNGAERDEGSLRLIVQVHE